MEQALGEGRMAVVVEYSPPVVADADAVRAMAAAVRGKADAVGVLDNHLEIMMSAIATAALLRAEGVEPIVHATTRDRNRIALISDVLGARALGLRNFLCTSGDHQTLGRERASRNVFDLDSVQLISVLNHMRRDGILFETSRPIEPCDLYLGATANPFADPQEMHTIQLTKKIQAGADFIVTQPVFDVGGFGQWLQSLRGLGIVEKAAILVGILVPSSDAEAREISRKMPGVEAPEAIISRIASAPPARQRDEAIAIAAELIAGLRALDGVRGFYLMTGRDTNAALELIERSLKSKVQSPRSKV